MLEVNAYDVDGTSSKVANNGSDPTQRASVYVRRGAIELEQSPSATSSTVAADEGFGYIKANRFVSNVSGLTIPNAPVSSMSDTNRYDQYMVNPAYTSVMHDIKLTTRGGARVSDILPDYVLKGVYNISNDFVEGGTNKTDQLCWSSGRTSDCLKLNVAWADPYVGKLPYAICPPGYKNLATLIPTSFQMAQAGDMVKATAYSHGRGGNAFVINPAGSRQADILSAATTNGDLAYPTLVRSDSLEQNKAISKDEIFDADDMYIKRTEGWFFGYEALRENTADITADTNSRVEYRDGKAWFYEPNGTGSSNTMREGFVPEPLYFQQNTYLKTALEPLSFEDGGWNARMGFIYNMKQYAGYGDDGLAGHINLQNAPERFEDADGTSIQFPADANNEWRWNLFPVPTNTLEGHATVYCYFDRAAFKDDNGWSGLVDHIDQINKYRNPKTDGAKDDAYKQRLNDPSLKYNDPW